VSLPPVVLLASPDDYLLEIEREDVVADWRSANQEGEVVSIDTAPQPAALLRRLIDRSLFAPTRLLVVRDAAPYLNPATQSGEEGKPLLAGLQAMGFEGVALVLAALVPEEPAGPLVELIGRRGEVRFLPRPAAPKPWEEVRVSQAERRVLERVLQRVAPPVAERPEVVDALCEVYGFHARELAQAARRLLLGGEISADVVRAQAGAGECSLRTLEGALMQRDRRGATHLLGSLAAGAALVDWRGEAVAPEGWGPVVAGSLSRLLRQALAVRAHARRAGLAKELEPRRCAASDWYWRSFKPRIHARLKQNIDDTPDSPLARLSVWQLHRLFRLAAAYGDDELLAAVGRLTRSGAERLPARAALGALIAVVVGLMEARPGVGATAEVA
jgi:hypothetical protein